MPDIADPKTLPTYRLSIMTKMIEGFGAPAGSVDYMKYEFVTAQKAEHAWREDANGKITETYIKIGDKYWIWFGMAGMGWVEQPPATTADSSMPSDLVSQLKQVQKDAANAKVRFDKKGTETVNNVRCIRYDFEYSMTTDFPNIQTGGTTKTDSHSIGQMWIADQSGLPAVLIKSKSTTTITTPKEKSVMESEQNVTDIGANITINPPDGAFKPPTGIPTAPSTTKTTTPPPTTKTTTPAPTTTTPATTTTPPTTTGVAPIYNDNFDGAWNSGSVWTDPNNDVTYSFTARPGFLRLTVPDGNDLAGAVNYDAPRLLVPQNGGFSLETLVEFDPQETYQGAGLLIWQDEDHFIRLEFAYGGMSGREKNVSFVKGEHGDLELVNSISLPNTLKRIELRLQRVGNQYVARYRQVGGTWLEIGTTDFSLNDTVNVGITQVTQYTSSVISADFDYFRVYKP
jgi:regulation of enolase protein 1 (concanavalin A-like superfamily)